MRFLFLSVSTFIETKQLIPNIVDSKHLSLSNVVSSEKVSQSYYKDLSGYSPVVFNQGVCGNCYAYSSIEGINTNNKVKGRSTPYLSPQHLTDCSTMYNFGCQGGYLIYSMVYALHYGIHSIADYPLNATVVSSGIPSSCRTIDAPKYKINNAYRISVESDLCISRLSYVYSGYSLSTAMAASSSMFQYYSSGILMP